MPGLCGRAPRPGRCLSHAEFIPLMSRSAKVPVGPGPGDLCPDGLSLGEPFSSGEFSCSKEAKDAEP